jgi:ankyrin repeat protein
MARESDPAWRNRDLPPSPNQAYQMAKILSWIDRGGSVNDTGMDKQRGHSFLMSATINNNESLVAELLKRGANTDLYAQGKTALHFAAILGHSNCSALMLQRGARTDLRVAVDDSDHTECDGMTVREIVEQKLEYARDPLR